MCARYEYITQLSASRTQPTIKELIRVHANEFPSRFQALIKQLNLTEALGKQRIISWKISENEEEKTL